MILPDVAPVSHELSAGQLCSDPSEFASCLVCGVLLVQCPKCTAWGYHFEGCPASEEALEEPPEPPDTIL